MRNTFRVLTVLFLVLSAGFTYSQGQYRLTIQVNDEIPVMNFTELIPNGNVRGAVMPELFRLTLTAPDNQDVALGAQFFWKDIGSSDFEVMAEYKSVSFKVAGTETFTNRDLDKNKLRSRPGSEGFKIYNDVVNRNLTKGKPTGTYKIVFTLYKANGPTILNPEASDQASMTFSNPTQTLTITLPRSGDAIDEGNFRIDWTAIASTKKYIVRGVLRATVNQSPEDALISGQEVYYKMFDGNKTSANSTELDKRREIPANNFGVVFQVIALVPGTGQDVRITSTPVDVTVNTPNNSPINNPVVNFIQTLQSNPQLLAALSGAFSQALSSGNLRISGMVDENGSPVSASSLQQLLVYLQQNPTAISNIRIINN